MKNDKVKINTNVLEMAGENKVVSENVKVK